MTQHAYLPTLSAAREHLERTDAFRKGTVRFVVRAGLFVSAKEIVWTAAMRSGARTRIVDEETGLISRYLVEAEGTRDQLVELLRLVEAETT